MNTAAWPAAAPAAFDWSRFTLRTVPAHQARAARSRRMPDELTGTATRFGVFFVPADPAGTRVMLLPGCLDKSLARIAAGRDEFVFNAGHSGVVLATSRDRCLRLWTRGDELLFRLSGHNDAGRVAIRAVVTGTRHRHLSIGLRRGTSIKLRHAAVPTIALIEAEISEISLLSRGAIPGCRLVF
jgi:hypothetical protein